MDFDSGLDFLSQWCSVIESSFSSQIITAAVGSFFGAVGGYVLVWITNNRTEIKSKVGHINMAIAMSHSLFNIFYSLKKQHVKSLCDEYQIEKKQFTDIKEGKVARTGTIPVFFDFKTLSFPYLDIDIVNSKLFDKAEISGRAFFLADALLKSINELKNQFSFRHTVIMEINQFSEKMDLNAHDRACLYFGITLSTKLGSITNTRYLDVMNAIELASDECIWFSKELTEELMEFGKGSAKNLWFSRPKIFRIEYTDIDLSLMPEDKKFKSWREKFKKAENRLLNIINLKF